MIENRPLRMMAVMKVTPKNFVSVILCQSSKTWTSSGSLSLGQGSVRLPPPTAGWHRQSYALS